MPFALPTRLKKAWQALTYKADALSDLRHPTAWLSAWAFGPRTAAGVDVSPMSAMTLPPYFAAIRNISEDVAKLPFVTYERLMPRGKRRATEHPLYAILHDAPNPWMSAMSWREAMTHHALAWGNAYAEILMQAGQVVGLGRPIHPSRVEPKFDASGELVYDVHVADLGIRSEGQREFQTIRYPQRLMFHLRGLGTDGLHGYSVARFAAESLGLGLAAQRFGASFFGNSTHLGGILTHPQILGDQAAVHLRESLDKFRLSEDAMKVLVLEEGMKYERVGIPPEDAQFLQTREFQVIEIARWFRIPPHKIAHMNNATFSNIEHQGLEYVVDTLQPWLVRWEQETARKLFADAEDFFAEHLVLGLLRGDQQARSNYYRTLFYIGALSPNDIRELENQNPITDADGDLDPAGDLYYIQNNLATLGTVAGTRAPIQTMTQPNGEEFAMIPLHKNGHTAPYPWEQS